MPLFHVRMFIFSLAASFPIVHANLGRTHDFTTQQDGSAQPVLHRHHVAEAGPIYILFFFLAVCSVVLYHLFVFSASISVPASLGYVFYVTTAGFLRDQLKGDNQ